MGGLGLLFFWLLWLFTSIWRAISPTRQYHNSISAQLASRDSLLIDGVNLDYCQCFPGFGFGPSRSNFLATMISPSLEFGADWSGERKGGGWDLQVGE